jgi:hypothetical protein
MMIKIKEAFKKDWVSREAGEKLRLKIISGLSKNKTVDVDFGGMKIASVSFMDEGISKLALEKNLPITWKDNLKINNLYEQDKLVLIQMNANRGLILDNVKARSEKEKIHPWRICPIGEHWVNKQNRVSKNGKKFIRNGHCRLNPSRHELYTTDELTEISNSFHMRDLKYPNKSNWKFANKNENKFDMEIAGWTRYWNDIFKPKTKLDPNLVKALIASESGFKVNVETLTKKNKDKAQGLIQITQETKKILNNPDGELGDHIFQVEDDKVFDPNINIAMGIRWLFYKKEYAKTILKREPTWAEVIDFYKGIWKDESKVASEIRLDVGNYYEKIKEKKKSNE